MVVKNEPDSSSVDARPERGKGVGGFIKGQIVDRVTDYLQNIISPQTATKRRRGRQRISRGR